MTREEIELAITYLEEMKESYIGGVGYERYALPEYYAIENAIKALEQEPTTKNDLAVEKIVDVLGSYTDLDIPYKHEIAEDILNTLPSVTPIRPRGHWIKQNDDYYDWYECSECGYGSEGEMQYSSEYDVRTNYCPNCGADMRTSED